jgi:hypothetical protein
MSADLDVLAMLDASPVLVYIDEETDAEPVENAIYWGYLNVDETAKVIAAPMPYLVFNSSPGYDRDERYSGSVNGRVLEFQLTGVAETERQAKWILDQARNLLNRKRLNGALIRRLDDNQNVRRDDDYTRPGGEPIFYGVDRYAVAV